MEQLELCRGREVNRSRISSAGLVCCTRLPAERRQCGQPALCSPQRPMACLPGSGRDEQACAAKILHTRAEPHALQQCTCAARAGPTVLYYSSTELHRDHRSPRPPTAPTSRAEGHRSSSAGLPKDAREGEEDDVYVHLLIRRIAEFPSTAAAARRAARP